MPIVLLCGDDSYRLGLRLQELIRAFEKKYDPAGLNILKLEGEDASESAVREALHSAGFLGSKRMVAISNLFASGQAKDFFDILNDPKSCEDSVLVLKEQMPKQELEKDSVFKKLNLEKIKVEEYGSLRGNELTLWIKNEFKKCGSSADLQAITLLSRSVGADLWLLRREIEKLSAYARGRVIGAADVKLLLSAADSENIFEFLDAISVKNSKKAAETLHREIEAGGPQSVIYQLIRQFRTMLALRDCLDRNPRENDANILAKKIGAHPFVVKKTLGSLNNFTKGEIKSVLDDLLGLDRSIKNGTRSEEVAFDLFLSKLLGRKS